MERFPLANGFEQSLEQMSHSELVQLFVILDRFTSQAMSGFLARQTGERVKKGFQRIASAIRSRGQEEQAEEEDEEQLDAARLREWLQKQTMEVEGTYTADELRGEMLGALSQRCSFDGPLSENLDREYALVTAFRDVGNEFDLNVEDLSIEELPREVIMAVTGDTLEEARKALQNASAEEENEVLQTIQQSLNAMEPEVSEELQRTLGTEELNPNDLLRAVRSGSAVGRPMFAEDASGVGVFLVITTLTHAVFTTLLGLTLPLDRYQTLTTVVGAILGPLGIAGAAGSGLLSFLRQTSRFDRKVVGQALLQTYGMELLGPEPGETNVG